MDTPAPTTVAGYFVDLPDPRTGPAVRHELLDIVTIAVCAVLCGADTWVDVALFGRSKEPWLRSFLALPRGIPSHDTFGRVFAALAPRAFEAAFLGWVRDQAAGGGDHDRVVAIDGKTARRSHDRANGRGPLHLVSAWATDRGLVLGQLTVADTSNEIVAIPALLDVLEVKGAVVTIDAMGCQRAIAQKIRARGADSVLALKDNQPTLHDLVAHHFAVATADPAGLAPATHATVERGHGRRDARRCWASDDPGVLTRLDPDGVWPGLQSVAAVVGARRRDGATTAEVRSDLSSLPADAARIARTVRRHWEVENCLHWVLDVAFREDESRVRVGHAAENLAVLRHLALNLLRRETTARVGIKAKRLRCGWDPAYLRKVLAP